MEKKLVRPWDNRMLFGVCAGIGKYFNVDATIIRLIFAFLLFSGVGLLGYLVAALIIPNESVLD